jgi:alkylation response protein AidB-like acyl-CoA dehydrogenase
MELEFTSEQDDLRDSIRAVLAKESPVGLARRVAEGGAAPAELWATVIELGWPALTIPETYGGLGLGMLEAGILAEELGRVIAPGALLPTVTQFAPAVRETATDEQAARFLGAVARGEMSGTLAIAERTGSFDPADVRVAATVVGGQVVLTGEKRFVIEGDAVDEIVVVVRLDDHAEGDDGIRAVVVPAADLDSTLVHAVDGTRRLTHLHHDGERVGRDR